MYIIYIKIIFIIYIYKLYEAVLITQPCSLIAPRHFLTMFEYRADQLSVNNWIFVELNLFCLQLS